MENNNKALKIYKASAGSGKTYRLALEYIKLVINDPRCYDKILAVTFTNKATKEMKNRILKELYGISRNLPHSMKESVCEELSSNEIFNKQIKEFSSNNNLSEEENKYQFVTEQAEKALYNILHDYSRFRIETIDSFFQSILRNLAKELGLGAYLNIELDTNMVLSDSIDALLDEVKEEGKKHLLSWITNYMKEQIESGKPWKIQSLLEEFGKNIFKEEYLRYSNEIDEKLKDHNFLKEYKKRISAIKAEKVNEVQEKAKALKSELSRIDLNESNLSYGNTGVAGHINALCEIKDSKILEKETPTRVNGCLNDEKKWVNKGLQKEPLLSNIKRLIPMLETLEATRMKNREDIITCDLISKNINNLGLLHDISRIIHQLNSERNTFLLAYTPTLLSEMIKESDAPFIYEKIGSHIEHIMIDEFQDTSITQWDNFKPLVKESLSHGTGLIVGDPKQSIYRFRNGDWRILGEIKNSHEFGDMTQVETLKKNWRSKKNVVEFNNNIFKESLNALDNNENNSHILMQQLREAYGDCVQEPKSDKDEGLAKVKFIKKEKENPQTMLEALASEIHELQNAGVKSNEIAILVRTNKEIPIIASYFSTLDKSKYPGTDFDLVSDEAYLLKSSSAVEIVLNTLRVIASPDSLIAKLHLHHSYKSVIKGENADEILKLKWEEDEEFKKILSQIEEISHLPLYELMEEIYRLLLSQKNNTLIGQDAYLCFFMDKVSEYLSKYSPNITSFLKYWEEHLCNKSLPSSGNINGIRILSIHKSKGLEYHSVLIPYCNWSLESEVKSYSKWYKTGNYNPYNQIPILPIDHQKKVGISIFKEEYLEESIQNLADNLNILYVALTRAEKNLILLSYYNQEKMDNVEINNVSNLLLKIMRSSNLFTPYFSEETMEYKFGEILTSKEKEIEKSTNPFDPQGEEILVEYYSNRQKARFKQSIKSNQFIENSEEDGDNNEYLSRGRLLHYLFSNINTIDDIPSAIEKLEFEGVITSKEEREKLLSFVTEKLQSEEAKNWFRPGLTLFNECSILFRDENGELQTRRPDRVIKEGQKMTVVDFKFGKPSRKYQDQIDEYVELLTKMGYEATGHIWYVGVPN